MAITPQKITPFLWFDDNAEQAANFYVSTFANSRIEGISRYGESTPGEPGSVMTVQFQLEGQQFTALNGGPGHTPFTPAVSLVVSCDTQAEIDDLWTKLTSDDGTEVQCGWLADKFGLSWQIVPSRLSEWVMSGDADACDRMMAALMKMKKLDIAALQAAYDSA